MILPVGRRTHDRRYTRLVGAIVQVRASASSTKMDLPTPPGHNIPMGVLGTIILFFGWFGFNPARRSGFVGAFATLQCRSH